MGYFLNTSNFGSHIATPVLFLWGRGLISGLEDKVGASRQSKNFKKPKNSDGREFRKREQKLTVLFLLFIYTK